MSLRKIIYQQTKYAIKALTDVLDEYQSIGTVEECRAAVEKQRAVEAIKINDSNFEYQCPKCHFKLEIGFKHCISCGQLLKYSSEIVKGGGADA